MASTATSSRIFPANALKPGDRITFDFRGARNHLGDVEIFDAYPMASTGCRLVQLVLIDSAGEYHYRQVATDTPFAVR